MFKVDAKNQLRYWICAFCINQHASICGSSMGVLDTVTQEVLPCCDCATPKSLGEMEIARNFYWYSYTAFMGMLLRIHIPQKWHFEDDFPLDMLISWRVYHSY